MQARLHSRNLHFIVLPEKTLLIKALFMLEGYKTYSTKYHWPLLFGFQYEHWRVGCTVCWNERLTGWVVFMGLKGYDMG